MKASPRTPSPHASTCPVMVGHQVWDSAALCLHVCSRPLPRCTLPCTSFGTAAPETYARTAGCLCAWTCQDFRAQADTQLTAGLGDAGTGSSSSPPAQAVLLAPSSRTIGIGHPRRDRGRWTLAGTQSGTPTRSVGPCRSEPREVIAVWQMHVCMRWQ